MISDSTIPAASKKYLEDCEEWIPKMQIRNFKYGSGLAVATFFFMPVVRRQPFVRRTLISLVPFYYFMMAGYR